MFKFHITFKKDNFKITYFLPYIISFLITFSVLLFFSIYYKSGHGNPLVNTLELDTILINGIASTCALYYLKHAKTFYLSSFCAQLLLATSYGLCSYGIVQESFIPALLVYAFFPILFLTYEIMLTAKKYCPFIISMTLLLSIHPATMLPIFLLLTILCLFDLILQKELTLGNYVHLISCFAMSFLLSSFRISPYLSSMYPVSYSGFSTSYPFLMFLSRFLPFGSISISLKTTNGFDTYTGFFLLILVLIFFVSPQITKAKKIAYGFIILLVCVTISVSPLRFLFSLFTESNRFSVFFSFFLIFWGFRLASEALSTINSLNVPHITAVFVLSTLYLLACFISFKHNFINYSFLAMFILSIMYCILLFLYKKGKKTIPILSICLLLLGEMTVSIWISTNLNLYPQQRSVKASYIWDTLNTNSVSNTNTDTNNETSTEDFPLDLDTYTDFVVKHQNKEELEILNNLTDTVSVDSSEYEEMFGTMVPNIFQQMNGAAKKIGCKEELFTPTSVSISFESTDNYSISNVSDNIFFFYGEQNENASEEYVIPFQLTKPEDTTSNLYVYNDYTEDLFSYNTEQLKNTLKAYTPLYTQNGIGVNFQILTYTLNQNAFEYISSQLDNDTSLSNNENNSTTIYVGMVLSCIGLLLFFTLYFNSDKEKVYAFLYKQKHLLSQWKLPKKICSHVKNNYVYYLAFIFPVLVFLVGLLIYNCTPFGACSTFSGDGTALTLPSYWECYHNLKVGNKYMAFNSGYGTNQYANHPFIGFLSFLLLFDANQIPVILQMLVALCLGLSGLTMVYYLTHRINGKTAKKTDYRLLVAAFIYSLNAYMIAMRDFPSWYFVLAIFPLLMLSFELMLYKKKTLPYVLLLTLCISSNLYLALYMCIFLVIYFFTCYFEGVRDLLNKGIRFALCSILAAGNSFLVIANTLFSSADSLYRESDAIFPTFGLHTNFLEQWKRQLMFSTSNSVTSDNGMANLYYGITTICFILIFVLSTKHSLKDKLRKIIPIIILYISFNEQVLSYLWNGLHYQSKVPNRFVFLLMFLVASIGYDGICELKKVSTGKLVGTTIFICSFILVIKFGTKETELITLIVSLIICILLLLFFLIFTKKRTILLTKSIILLLSLELCINTIYFFSYCGVATVLLYGNYTETTALINTLEEDCDYFRTTFPSSTATHSNAGGIYDTNTVDSFNSFVTAHQNNLNKLLGFYSSVNYIKNLKNSTPFGLSMSSTKYILLPALAQNAINNMDHYPYLGATDLFYVYENPNALSVGFYVPNEMLNLDVDINDPIKFSNDFVTTYMKKTVPLLHHHQIKYNSDTSTENSFIFTDAYGKTISADEAFEIYSDTSDDSNTNNLHLKINLTSELDGPTYMYAYEFISIGSSVAHQNQTYDIGFPNANAEFSHVYDVVTLDEELLNRFCNTVKQNQLENIKIENDTLTGTTNYAEDGYTMFSLAYDKGWHAYIDGEEVPIEDPYDAMMFIKTPKGKHTITLKYIPYGMNFGRTVSLIFIGITILIYSVGAYRKRSSKKKN